MKRLIAVALLLPALTVAQDNPPRLYTHVEISGVPYICWPVIPPQAQNPRSMWMSRCVRANEAQPCMESAEHVYCPWERALVPRRQDEK